MIAALVAWSVPILSMWPLGPGLQRLGVVEAAWTWWLPYLGAYLMGWALRGVLLPRRWVVPAIVLAVGLMALHTWEWGNPAAPAWLTLWFGAHYYSPSVALLAILVFLLAQTLIRPDGALRSLTTPGVMRWASPLGAATMGIFALHFLILIGGIQLGLLGASETTWPMLVLRFAVVSVVTTVVVLVLRKVPYVRQVF